MQYYQEGHQGLLGRWRETRWPSLSIEGGGAAGRSGSCGADRWSRLLIFFPPLLSPFPGKVSGSPPEDSPFFCWVSSTPKKGIQGSSMGLLTSWGPALRAEQGHPGTVPCFHFRCFQPAAQKDLSQESLTSPRSPQPPNVWAMILLMYV